MTFIYPERLLPSIEKSKAFTFCQKCFLCRWCSSAKDMLDEDGELNPSAIEIERIFGFSTNVIGCSSHKEIPTVPEDILIEVADKKLTRTIYSNDDSLVPNPESIEGRYDNERGYFFINIENFDGHEAKYPFQIPNKAKVEKQFTLKVEYVPLIINLYHFEVNCYNPDGIIKKWTETVWKEDLAHIIRNHILDNYSLTL